MGIRMHLERVTEEEERRRADSERKTAEKRRCKEEERRRQRQLRIAKWNAEKGPLVQAHNRLQVSGALDILNDLSQMVTDPNLAISPYGIDSPRILFDPKSQVRVQARLEWHRQHLYSESGFRDEHGEMPGRSWEQWYELCLTAPVESPVIVVDMTIKRRGDWNESTPLLRVTLPREDWEERDSFERTVAQALWRGGLRLPENEQGKARVTRSLPRKPDE